MMFWLSVTVVAILLYYAIDRIRRKPMLNELHKRYILVTGCDMGFGRYAVKRLDKMGCHVIAGCLQDSSLKELSQECSSRVIAVKMDVASDEEVHEAARKVGEHIPQGQGLHAVINNAGLSGPVGPLEWMNTERMHFVLNINLYGILRVTNAFLPLLRRSPGSRVINTASVVGRTAIPNTGAYSISKHAVEAYSDQLRRELRPFGMSVHTIEPGAHMTNFMDRDRLIKNTDSMWEGLSEGMRDLYGRGYYDKMIYLSTQLIPSIATSTPDGVVSAYIHAALSRRPRTRYSIGADSMLYLWHSYMPSCIQDWLLALQRLEPRPASYKA